MPKLQTTGKSGTMPKVVKTASICPRKTCKQGYKCGMYHLCPGFLVVCTVLALYLPEQI